MTEQERADLERRLAERLGDGAWELAATCPQGHAWDATVEPGGYCPACVEQYFGTAKWFFVSTPEEMNAQQTVLAQHPEWRIGRQPKALARSLDVLTPLVETWCKTSGYIWLIKYFDEEDYLATIWPRGHVYGRSAIADTPAEALALALDAALAQEGGRDG